MLTRYFLHHPRLSQIIALVIVICGLLCLPLLPTLEYPQVTPPQIEVRATYIGATADQVERAVATPIEQEVNGIENLLYLSSQSASDGSMTLTATFKPHTNTDIAALTVQNRVERAKPWLPQEVLDYGVTTQKSYSTQLMFINLYSSNPEHNSTWLSNYASLYLKNALARLPGVGNVDILGKQDYSLRIWMDSARMTSLGLTPADIEAAVRDQNREIIAGKVGQSPGKNNQQLEYALEVNGLLGQPEEFENIILRKSSNDKVLKLGDVARIEQGADNYNIINRLDDHSAIHLAIYQEPDANGLNVSKAIKAEMERLSGRFPGGVHYMIPHDISTFVKETIKELQVALFLTILLVSLVIYLFLTDWRATLIPIVTIPVSLIGSFAILYSLGYSLNTVTLFGLVLAVGIVVDDAIIVVENVQRQIHDNHLKPYDAVMATMKEVTAPVIATTLVLIAVFLPIGFIPGTSGQFYKEFGIATSSAVLISSLCALTLSPVMSASLLGKPNQPNRLQQGLNNILASISSVYLSWTAFLLKKLWLALSLLVIASALTLWLFKTLPKGFIPNDDRGFFFVAIQLPDSHALNRTDQVAKKINQLLMSEPEIEHTITVTGLNLLTFTASPSAALMVAMLKPWEQRKSRQSSVDAIMGRIQKKLYELEEAMALAIIPSAIPAISSLGGFDYKLQDQNNHTTTELSELLTSVLNEAQQQPEILYAFSSYRANEPRILLEVDRKKLRNQGISLASVHDALHSHLGSKYIDKYHKYGRIYQIKIQSDSSYRASPDDIEAIHVKNDQGKMVPLTTLVTTRPIQSPSTIEHYNLFRTASISGQPTLGYSTEEAMRAMERISSNLPDGYDFDWSGLSLQQRESGKLTAAVLVLAILFAYLFLVAQLESWILPLAVIVSIPLSLAGALTGLYMSGLDNNIYAQLGLILLVGLAAKNAILIVEFARHRELEGSTTEQAALTAAKLRFRAVMMTGLSFILGVMPLLISSGAGATGRASLGTPVFWGMISVAILSTLLTPAFYLCVRKIRYPLTRK
ncbi:efflux RND transporter permease subunit [Endozoicomonas sp. Mp262]|uniref:efflux RND transporter permease subunit n=1 Tax=Endozoicomonas sp. Mp262 TaxID=2919499 RepID=UPI0021DF7AA4